MNGNCKELREQLVGFPDIGYDELQHEIRKGIRNTWLMLGGWTVSLSGLVAGLTIYQPLL